MSKRYNRDIKVTIGTVEISSRSTDDDVVRPTLRMAFTVEQQLKGEPNTAEISIWNLSEDTRSRIQESVPAIIEAGYVGETSRIFSGDMSFASTTKQGPDAVTRFEAGDGENAYRSARINKSFKGGVTLSSLLKEAAKSMGIGLGNVSKKADAGDFRGALEEFANGEVLSGKASDVLDRLTKTAGFDWQINDNQIQFFKANETTEDTAIHLALENGLIGSPEFGEKGEIKARSLLQGGLFPGRKVEIKARDVDGFFKVHKATHTGDTHGNDWYTDIEARAL